MKHIETGMEKLEHLACHKDVLMKLLVWPVARQESAHLKCEVSAPDPQGIMD